MRSLGGPLLGLAAAVSLPAAAFAADDPRIAAMEAQIRALQSQLTELKQSMAASPAAASHAPARTARRAGPGTTRQAQAQLQPQPAPPGAAPMTVAAGGTDPNGPPSSVAPPSTSAPNAPVNPGGVSFPKGRPTFTSNDGRFSAAVGLQLHYDVGGEFQGSRPGNADTRQYPRLDRFGENLRRARLPFVFSYDDFQVNITPDFGNSPDGSPTLYEANINWTPTKQLTATLGYFKPWLTLQDSMSSNDFLFLERPSIVEASRNIAAGDARSSAGVRWAADRYFAAGYFTGSSYGSQGSALAENGQTGATLRLAGRPLATADWDAHLGFSASQAFHLQRSVSGQTINIQDRPELRIDQNRLVSTGALNARSAGSYGPEFGLRWRNLLLQGEYIGIHVDRPNGGTATPTPGLSFDGGYVEASWVVTGETRPYVPSAAAFGSPRPRHPFSLRDGGAGAFEVVGRFSTINLNDNVVRGRSAASTGGVYGGKQDVYALGVNWYPNEQLRFMLDYDIIAVDKLNPAGTVQIGQRVQAVGFRAQAAF